MKKTSAFTLIELLTVIAIIGILAAILIPVVGSVRDSARTAKCTSNIRESGIGLLLMAEANEFKLTTFGSGSGGRRWAGELRHAGIVENPEVFYCPSAQTGLGPNVMFEEQWDWRTYGLNMYDTEYGGMFQVFGQSGNRYGVNLNAVQNPSLYIVLADTIDPRGYSRFRLERRDHGGDASIHLLHNRRANVFFLDGHVESCDPPRLGNLGMISGHGADLAEVIVFPRP